MAVSAPPRGIPRVLDFQEPERLKRIPVWASTAGLLVFLMVASAFLRTRYITGQFWKDEAITTGIASHSLSAIPGVLRHDGSPPLFYLLLHVWISIFGASEAATHALSLVFGLLCIPAGMWAGWSLFGRRAGVYMAILFAFSTFLDRVRPGDADVRADGAARDPRHRGVHPRLRLPAPALPDHVRGAARR